MAYPKINSIGWKFREQFFNPATVIKNGGTIGSTVTVDRGATNTGLTGIDYSQTIVPAEAPWTLYFRGVCDDLTLPNGLLGQYYDDVNQRFVVTLNTDGTAKVQVGASFVTTANTITSGQPFEIFVSRDSANLFSIRLNQGTIATGTIATAIDQQATTLLYYDEGVATAALNGTMYDVRYYDRALSAQEWDNISNGTTFSDVGAQDALCHLELRSRYDDGVGLVTKNTGKGGGAFTLVETPDQLYPKGMYFNGSNEWLDSNENVYKIAGDITFGATFMVPVPQNSKGLIAHGFNGESEADNFLYSLDVKLDGGLQYVHEYGAGSNVTFNTGTDLIQPGKVHHAYVCRDTNTKQLTIYLDGIPVGGGAYSNNPTGGSAGDLNISHNQALGKLEAYIYDVKIYIRCLTETQIKWLYQQDINLINQ